MSIFFDSSTLISLATTCNLHWLQDLKKAYGGEFFISPTVNSETIGRGLQSLRFRYEAHRLKYLLDEGVLKIYPEAQVSAQINELMFLINNTFFARGKALSIVQAGEITILAEALKENADAVAIDERTTRLVIENPDALADLLEKKLHTDISVNKGNLKRWQDLVEDKITVIRSTEFAIAAWKKGLLVDKSKDALTGMLWALKFAGCAISESEINIYSKRFA